MIAWAGTLLVALALLAVACGGEDRADQEAFCAELRRSVEENVTVFDPQDPADPAEAEAALDELVALAPDEIEPDVTVLRDAFSELAGAIDDLDLTDPSAGEQLAEVELDEERIATAQAAMAAYGRDPCRIPLLNGPATPTTTTVAPTTTVPVDTSPPTSATATTG